MGLVWTACPLWTPASHHWRSHQTKHDVLMSAVPAVSSTDILTTTHTAWSIQNGPTWFALHSWTGLWACGPREDNSSFRVALRLTVQLRATRDRNWALGAITNKQAPFNRPVNQSLNCASPPPTQPKPPPTTHPEHIWKTTQSPTMKFSWWPAGCTDLTKGWNGTSWRDKTEC